MHTGPVPESSGKFTETFTGRNCSKCGSPMTGRMWESSDGAYEDVKWTCPNGHIQWVDGDDG